MRRHMGKTLSLCCCWLLSVPAICGCGTPSKAVGAALNVGMATAFGAARVASGECFTWCDAQHICNPRTGLCEPMPDCERCQNGQRCELVGGVGVCVDAVPNVPMLEDDATPDPTYGPMRMLPPLSPDPLYQKKVE